MDRERLSMKKYLIILTLFLLPLGCVAGLEDLIPESWDEEEECWYEEGSQPGSFITPEGHSYQCDETSNMRLGAGGAYEDLYETGKWSVDYNGRLCILYDPQAECLWSCQKFVRLGDTLNFSGYKHFWKKEEYLGGSELPDTCILLED